MKKVLNIILLVTLFCFVMSTAVNALSFTATMTPSSTSVPEATEFTVTIKVSNLDVGTNGINSLKGYLKYDTEVFETISESSIEALNSWTSKYDDSTGKIELTKNTFVKSSQEILQIAFKTKAGVTGKSGTISYSNIVASNSESDISASDISASITVGAAEAANTNPETTQNTITINSNTSVNNTSINVLTANSIDNNTVSNNTVSNITSSYVNTVTNTNSEENMPNTGVDDTILKVVFVVIGIALVFYIKIEKINNEMR